VQSSLQLNPPAVVHDLPEASFPADLLAKIRLHRIAAVITVDDVQSAVPLARALYSGGIRLVELAWRTDATCQALKAIKNEIPDMIIGLGTLLSASQLRAAVEHGAAFGVSPGFSAAVTAAAKNQRLPFAPGIQTSSELQLAIEHGCRFVKYFPAVSAGGIAHLRNLHAPLAHLGVEYLPLGGINEHNAAIYLAERPVAAIGGSWIAPTELIRERAWDEIGARAKAACRLTATTSHSES
jgi:2-dehydro-3-deoxyphosphogluconate aldolase/(4S)-4-hydroxy-2-oxoglutarate aldolase